MLLTASLIIMHSSSERQRLRCTMVKSVNWFSINLAVNKQASQKTSFLFTSILQYGKEIQWAL